MRLAIVGSRGFNGKVWVEAAVRKAASKDPDLVVVSGGARGVDTWAAAEARRIGVPVVELLADWDKYGKAAGHIRNGAVVQACDVLLAFWDGMSPGTADAVRQALAAGKKVRVIREQR